MKGIQCFLRLFHLCSHDHVNNDAIDISEEQVGSPPNTPRTPPRRSSPPTLNVVLPSIAEERENERETNSSVDSSNSATISSSIVSLSSNTAEIYQYIREKVQSEISGALENTYRDIRHAIDNVVVEKIHSEVRAIVAIQLHNTLKNIVAAELNAKVSGKILVAKKEIMAAVSEFIAAAAPPAPPAPPAPQTCDAGTQYGSAANCACNSLAGFTCAFHAQEKSPRTLKEAILQNQPIEKNLHVIAVISNPCNFRRREQLMREFSARMEREPNVILYIVELAYGDQQFHLTRADCSRHLQIRTAIPLWHKENMINLGVRYLLPPNWRAMAWIDADVDFENANWALDTLKVLNGYRDIVQLFSHAVDMDATEATMNVYNSFGFQHDKGLPYTYKFPNYWHPGYAWAVTREAFEKMRTPGDPSSGIFDLGILGASDHIMTFCYRGNGLASINDKYTQGFKDEITRFEGRVRELRLGYIPGVIRHYFHGSKVNRKYVERNEILLRHHYDPARHITRDASGIFVPTADFPAQFAHEIYDYFLQRNEDE